MSTRERGKSGFASMDPAKVRKIAGMGGKAAHRKGVAHEWTSETARLAGAKGGSAMHKNRGNSSILRQLGKDEATR